MQRPAVVALAVIALGLATSPATATAVPSITVTPNTGLNYFGQDVNITGAGWSAQGFPIQLRQAPEGYRGGAKFKEIPADAGGGFSVTAPVEPHVLGGGPLSGVLTVNCRETPCWVYASQDLFAASPPLEATAPIRFAPFGGVGPGGPTFGPGDDPATKVSGKRRQKLDRLAVTVVLAEDGTVRAGGTVFLPGASKLYRFKTVRKSARAGQRVKLRLKLGKKKGRRAIKRALRRRTRLSAEISVTATDKAGNKTRIGKTIRLKR
jgi:hypothetical protein